MNRPYPTNDQTDPRSQRTQYLEQIQSMYSDPVKLAKLLHQWDREHTPIGVEEGEMCNRNGCQGTIEIGHDDFEGGCCCHIVAPCSYCTDSFLICDTCSTSSNDPNFYPIGTEPDEECNRNGCHGRVNYLPADGRDCTCSGGAGTGPCSFCDHLVIACPKCGAKSDTVAFWVQKHDGSPYPDANHLSQTTNVVLVMDNDPAGKEYLRRIEERLREHGAQVVAVELPSHTKDLSDVLLDPRLMSWALRGLSDLDHGEVDHPASIFNDEDTAERELMLLSTPFLMKHHG